MSCYNQKEIEMIALANVSIYFLATDVLEEQRGSRNFHSGMSERHCLLDNSFVPLRVMPVHNEFFI